MAAMFILAGCLSMGIGRRATAELVTTTAPQDFPQFLVPGNQHAMDILRKLNWLHYPQAQPGPTFQDDLLISASLWPALGGNEGFRYRRQRWHDTLSTRIIDTEGYVASHQHVGLAHQLGWPFPYWVQGTNTWGWHASIEGIVPDVWPHPPLNEDHDGWCMENVTDDGIHDGAWHIKLNALAASVTTPEI